MNALTERQIRSSFVNCSQGEAKRAGLPDLEGVPWDDLDFLGWVDPKAPLVAYLVLPSESDGVTGIQLRRGTGGPGRKVARMCSLCTTVHSGTGVSLLVARRAGKAGREGNTVGLDICSDLACSLYARHRLKLPVASPAHETLSVDERVARLLRNTRRFVDRVTGG